MSDVQSGRILFDDSLGYRPVWSPDGLRLATINSDGTVRIWGYQ